MADGCSGRVLAIIAFAFAGAACSRQSAPSNLRAIPHQNVLLITIDTLRADALSAYGGPAATPALDRLAAEGVRFDFAHAHAVVTLPSHASILTGLYPFQHGIRDNSGYRLPAGTATIATLLKEQGYATAAFVGAFPLSARFGLNAGFDVYDDRLREGHGPSEFNMPERPATTIVALSRDWIRAHGRSVANSQGSAPAAAAPWFVWIHLFDPHAPYRPPAPFNERYAGRPYYGEVAATDAALGPLLEEVRAASSPTLVIATADHGEALGEHGEESHGLFAYEATLRVPLIVAEWPRPADTAGTGAVRGEVTAAPARLVDLVPTILDAVGQRAPSALPGRSLLDSAERLGHASSRPTYFEAMSGLLNRGWAPLSGVIVDREKLVDLPIVERYDLSADAKEQTNLAGRAPERDRTLAAVLQGFKPQRPGERPAEDAEVASQLRALGYVTGSAPAKQTYTDADDPKRLVELDRMVHRGVEAFTAGRPDEAAQIYAAILDRRPDMAIAYRHLAYIDARRGKLAEAVDVLNKAKRAGVDDERASTQMAEYLTELGRADDAIKLLEPRSDRTSDPDTLNTLGIAYARAHRTAAARRTFERVASLNPTSSVPFENLGMLALDRGDLTEARRQYERAIAIDPSSSRAHSGRGVAALRGGDRAGAIVAWSRAVQLDATNFEALYNLGTTLARAGDVSRARPYLEQFLRSAPPARFEADRREVARLLGR
jgi:arylsulfatase A-like enzyme/Flp pilus assembly protein TadD